MFCLQNHNRVLHQNSCSWCMVQQLLLHTTWNDYAPAFSIADAIYKTPKGSYLTYTLLDTFTCDFIEFIESTIQKNVISKVHFRINQECTPATSNRMLHGAFEFLLRQSPPVQIVVNVGLISNPRDQTKIHVRQHRVLETRLRSKSNAEACNAMVCQHKKDTSNCCLSLYINQCLEVADQKKMVCDMHF